MSNIFENAKFGDKFKTRDGRMAIYNGRSIDKYWLIVERHPWNLIGFNSCGRHSGLEEDIDIISKWTEESIDATIEMKSLDDFGTDIADACNKIVDYLLEEHEVDNEPIEKQAKEESDLYGMCFLDSGIHTSRNREQGFYDGFIAGFKKAKGL